MRNNNDSSGGEDQFMSLGEAMDQLLSDSFDSSPVASRKRLFPRVDISDTEGAIEVKADVPGLDPEDIQIEVDENSLSISGELEREEEERGDKFYRSERGYGKFSRSFRLPEKIDPENVTAEAEEGVLEITLPKKEKEGKKTITVKNK